MGKSKFPWLPKVGSDLNLLKQASGRKLFRNGSSHTLDSVPEANPSPNFSESTIDINEPMWTKETLVALAGTILFAANRSKDSPSAFVSEVMKTVDNLSDWNLSRSSEEVKLLQKDIRSQFRKLIED